MTVREIIASAGVFFASARAIVSLSLVIPPQRNSRDIRLGIEGHLWRVSRRGSAEGDIQSRNPLMIGLLSLPQGV
jgi:hypothetical protein